MTKIKFLISNSQSLQLKDYYDVAKLYPEHKVIHIEFTKEGSNSVPDKRWLVVGI